MANGLLSKVAIDKSNHDKNDEFAFRMQNTRDQFQELLLKMQLARQEWQDSADLANMLATIEKQVNRSNCKYCFDLILSYYTSRSTTFTKAPFRMEIFPFDGSCPLEWIFKINHLLKFSRYSRSTKNILRFLLFRWASPKLI